MFSPTFGAVRHFQLGNRTGLNAPGAKNTTYVYDALSRMTQAAGWTSQTTTYGYGAFGQVVTATLPNGVTTSYGYAAAQRQTSITHTLNSQTLASNTYTLDANGNRTRAVEQVQGLTQGAGQSLPGFGTIDSSAIGMSDTRTNVTGFTGCSS